MIFGLHAGLAVLCILIATTLVATCAGGGFTVYNWVVCRVQEGLGSPYYHGPPRGGAPPLARTQTKPASPKDISRILNA